jgi:uncharacterized tellurite resistance protein B-like protein
VQFLLENLSAVSRAVRYLREEDPNLSASCLFLHMTVAP